MFTAIDAPADYVTWADEQYSKMRNNLLKLNVEALGDFQLRWIAAPYFSLWQGKTRGRQGNVWVLHNLNFTDWVEESVLTYERQILALFAMRWQDTDTIGLRRQIYCAKAMSNSDFSSSIESQGELLRHVVDDESLW